MKQLLKSFRQAITSKPLDQLAQRDVLVTVHDGVATLTLNRPAKMNAFTVAMVDELTLAFNSVTTRDDVRAIVITGAGRAFCAGADLDELRRIHADQDMAAGKALVGGPATLYALMHVARQPVLCALNGPAAGGGANLALACDLRIASDAASLGQVFVKLGLAPDWGGSWFVPRMVGTARALELFLSGAMLPASRLLELGLVTRVVPAAEVAAAAAAWAAELAATPPLAVQAIKQLVYEGRQDIAAAMDAEVAEQVRLFQSDDFAEGLRAFTDKRQPRFTGR